MVVEDGRIAALGEGARPIGHFDREDDLSGLVAMPGFVNLHHHYFQTLTRAVPSALRGRSAGLAGPHVSRLRPPSRPMTWPLRTRASIAQPCADRGEPRRSITPNLVPPTEGGPSGSRDRGLARHGFFRTYDFFAARLTELEGALEARLAPSLGRVPGGLAGATRPRALAHHCAVLVNAHHEYGTKARLIRVGVGADHHSLRRPRIHARHGQLGE